MPDKEFAFEPGLTGGSYHVDWIFAVKDDYHVLEEGGFGLLWGDRGSDYLHLSHHMGWEEVGIVDLACHWRKPEYSFRFKRYDSALGYMLLLRKSEVEKLPE